MFVELAMDGGEQLLILDIPDRFARRAAGDDGQIRDHLAEPPIREYDTQLAQGM
jgi:hypothetical protein